MSSCSVCLSLSLFLSVKHTLMHLYSLFLFYALTHTHTHTYAPMFFLKYTLTLILIHPNTHSPTYTQKSSTHAYIHALTHSFTLSTLPSLSHSLSQSHAVFRSLVFPWFMSPPIALFSHHTHIYHTLQSNKQEGMTLSFSNCVAWT